MALGFLRKHRRWLFVFLWIVIVAFIVLYIPAFTGDGFQGGPGETLAEVGGLKVSAGEFQQAYARQREMYQRMYQGRLDPALLRSLGIEDQILDSLISERIVTLEASRLGLDVPSEEVARTLATSPEFQVDGKFMGSQELRRLLELRRITEEEFERGLRDRILRDKLEALVTDGISVTDGEAEREWRRRHEQVKLEYVLVDSAKYASGLTPSDEEIGSAFEARKDSYRIPEKRVLSYLLVDAEAMRARVTVTDAEIRARYDERQDEFKQPEQVCASHVLVKVKAGPEATEGHPDGEAKALAQAVLDKLRAGADLAELAKKASEDKGSAERGGDLGCFERGRMVPEFENVAFGLGAGETSDLVKTQYGYHVIRVASRREETRSPLSEVKERIRNSVAGERAETLAQERADAIADALRRGRGLDAAAKDAGLTVQTSAPLAKGEMLPPLTSQALIARAFELKPGEVEPEPFRVGPRGRAFVALAEVQPPRAAELKDAREKVRADLTQERARAAAEKAAHELHARAEKDGLEKAATALGLVRKETPALVGRGQPLGDLGTGHTLEEAAFTLPEKTLSQPVETASGVAVLRVLEKKPFDAVAFGNDKPSIVASLREQKKGQLFQSYLETARRNYAVLRYPAVLRRLVG